MALNVSDLLTLPILREGRLAAQDSTARFMTACEQAEAAYAARNPHKLKTSKKRKGE